MRLLWSFIFALAKANDLIVKLATDPETVVKNITFDVGAAGAMKANNVSLPDGAAWSLKLGADKVDKIIFGRLQMVSWS